MVNEIGGVDIDVTEPMFDHDSGAEFDAGHYHMDGDSLLAYSRDRKSYPHEGDRQRTVNQGKAIIAALATLRAQNPGAAGDGEAHGHAGPARADRRSRPVADVRARPPGAGDRPGPDQERRACPPARAPARTSRWPRPRRTSSPTSATTPSCRITRHEPLADGGAHGSGRTVPRDLGPRSCPGDPAEHGHVDLDRGGGESARAVTADEAGAVRFGDRRRPDPWPPRRRRRGPGCRRRRGRRRPPRSRPGPGRASPHRGAWRRA